MKHEDLIDIGFKLYGVEESDPFYQLYFKPPFIFGVVNLSGVLFDDYFLLYQNSVKYYDKNELIKVVNIVGNEIHGK